MKNLAKVLLAIGAISLVIGVVSKLINQPVLGSKPIAIFGVADTCLLLAIGLLLAEDKK
jgi:hypothetical protein